MLFLIVLPLGVHFRRTSDHLQQRRHPTLPLGKEFRIDIVLAQYCWHLVPQSQLLLPEELESIWESALDPLCRTRGD
jgi:hypothetical protein